MNNTPNINLSTYTSDPNDKFNLLVTFNNNMSKIDTAVGSQNDQIEVIEETASTAVTTANTASATATEALTTAETKTSVNDNVASATTTYSSNKINELISGIQPGTEIDDSVTSLTKTWSSSKINTEITDVETIANSKASINDNTASATTTYSSNKITNSFAKVIDIFNTTTETLTVTATYNSGANLVQYLSTEKTIETAGYYQIIASDFRSNTAINNASLRLGVYVTYNNEIFEENEGYNLNINSGHFYYNSPILYLKAGAKITFTGAAYNQTSVTSAPTITSVTLRKYGTLS